jgi:hypothetical protein
MPRISSKIQLQRESLLVTWLMLLLIDRKNMKKREVISIYWKNSKNRDICLLDHLLSNQIEPQQYYHSFLKHVFEIIFVWIEVHYIRLLISFATITKRAGNSTIQRKSQTTRLTPPQPTHRRTKTRARWIISGIQRTPNTKTQMNGWDSRMTKATEDGANQFEGGHLLRDPQG